MKTDLQHSHQAHAYGHQHLGSTPRNTTPVASSTRYTCPMHPEIVQDVPGNCPKCGMTLIPILKAIPRALSSFRFVAVADLRRCGDGAEPGLRGHEPVAS
jgi:hypothetical protein